MEHFEYKIREEYHGENIEVNVREEWKNGKIEEAYISCFGYSPMIRGISHKVGNYRPCEYGGVVGEITKRLSVEDVHDVIFQEIYNAEKSICRKKKIEHDKFYVTRHFYIIVDYKDQEVPVALMVKGGSDKVFIFHGHEMICRPADNFRNEIIRGIHNGMSAIDRGYVFPKPSIISKVKKKVKRYF